MHRIVNAMSAISPEDRTVYSARPAVILFRQVACRTCIFDVSIGIDVEQWQPRDANDIYFDRLS